MRAFLLLALSLLLAAPAAAQEIIVPPAVYPALPETARTAEDFVPAGWVIARRAAGDLNGDGKPDVLLLLQDADKANVITHDGMGESPFNANPRILAVAFGGADGYTLKAANHILIRRRDDPVFADVIGEDGGDISIDRGSVVVELYLFASAGGGGAGTTTYRLRWSGKDFQLIGFDRNMVERMQGTVEEVSINYLTGLAIRKTGTIESDANKTKTRRMPKKPPLTLEQVGDGMEFDPSPF